MSHVIRYAGLSGTSTTGEPCAVGDYLVSYDPDGGPPDSPSTGISEWSPDPSLAMRFETAAAAMNCYRLTSTRKPTRPDGRPNRPLTACSVSIEPLP
jgi:hypothetical protein